MLSSAKSTIQGTVRVIKIKAKSFHRIVKINLIETLKGIKVSMFEVTSSNPRGYPAKEIYSLKRQII